MAPPPSPSCAETRESKGGAAQPVLSAGPACGRRGLGAAAAGRWWPPARPRYSRAPPKFASHSRRAAEPGAQETGKFGGLRLPRPAPGAGRRGVAGGGMAREPKEEETVRPTALVRRCPRCPDWPGAPRPPLWLLCVVACWILGAVADADFSILDEAQVLASQMRRLAAEELGVVTMQVRDSLRAAPLAALSGCTELQGIAMSALAGCGTPRLLQSFTSNPLCPVHSSAAALLCRAHPLCLALPHSIALAPLCRLEILRSTRSSFPSLHSATSQICFHPALLQTPFPSLCPHPRAESPSRLRAFSKAPPLRPP